MIGRTNTGGGGGGGLNFKVVGNPQPTNPKENMIWVNTDVPITSYIFSAIEPEAPADGKDGPVWILTGTSSDVMFSVTKKNPITIYPISAKQYISGAWVDKTAKSYRNGEWVDWWNGELYDAGNTFEACTGGWASFGGSSDTAAGVITFNSDHMLLQAKATSKTGTVIFRPANDFDLTDVKSVTFVLSTSPQSDSRYAIGIRSVATNTYVASKKITSSAKSTYTLDVSGIREECAVWLTISSASSTTYSFNLYKAKLDY